MRKVLRLSIQISGDGGWGETRLEQGGTGEEGHGGGVVRNSRNV